MIIWRRTNQKLIGRRDRINRGWQAVDDINSSLKSKLPISKRKTRMSEKSEANINNVTMTTLNPPPSDDEYEDKINGAGPQGTESAHPGE